MSSKKLLATSLLFGHSVMSDSATSRTAAGGASLSYHSLIFSRSKIILWLIWWQCGIALNNVTL